MIRNFLFDIRYLIFNRTSPPAPVLWSFTGIGILAISCASIFIRLTDAPALTIATYRVGLAAIFLSPRVIVRPNTTGLRRSPTIFPLSLLAGSFLALHFFFWIESLSATSVASSVALVSTSPLFTGIFSALILKEAPRGRLWLGMLITMVGSTLIAGADYSLSREALKGDLLALLGAIMAAGYFLSGRSLRRYLDTPTYSFLVYGTAACLLSTACLIGAVPLSGFAVETYVFLFLLGLIPQLIGHTTFNWTLKFLPATLVAILTLGEPIGATLLAFFILGETVPAGNLVGLTILGGGIIFSALGTTS